MKSLFYIPDYAVDDPAVPLIRRNFFANMFISIAFFFGDTFSAYQTILPVFAATLTSSPIVIGLIPAISDAGWFLPQLFFASYLERIPKRLPLVRVLSLIEKLPYLLLVFAALWLPKLDRNLAAVLFILLIAMKGLTSGLTALPWQEMIATVIPGWLRGRFYGLSFSAGKLTGLGATILVGMILSGFAYPKNYALVFLFGFLGVMVSYSLIFLIQEPANNIKIDKPEALKVNSSKILGILKGNKNFSRFLISRGLSYMGGMATGFVAVYGIQRFNLPVSYAAIFTSLLVGFTILGFIVWGLVSDRFGQKIVLVGSSLFWIAALIQLLFVSSLTEIFIVFGLLGLVQPGNMIGDLNIVMEFGSGPSRPTYIGLARTLTAPFLLIAPIWGGIIVKMDSYKTMFYVALGFAIAGLIFLILGVQDPRQPKNFNQSY